MESVRTITAETLKRWMDERRDFVLIDTLPHEFYQQAHLPKAHNACVYEVTFLVQVRKISADTEKAVVLYGSSARSMASSVAAAKLAEAGYKNSHDFSGGIAAWRDKGYPLEGTPKTKRQPAALQDKTYRVDAANSFVEWTGRNLANQHTGTVRISEGELAVARGSIIGGYCLIDLNTIANTDIPDKAYTQVLVDHLKSDDFFDVAKHPSVRLVISRTDPIAGSTPGCPSHTVFGSLAVKGVAHDLDFPAMIGVTEAGELAAQAHFDLDRTCWGVLYGSGKFFENLGKHLVSDFISIQLRIIAR